uniref:G_PROTEIN_RECEP_F1_2 domain-containing protein n=1 Tax=Steinernema glaseri TaxID=37863 RepID=A0A1I7Y538_9BILA
MDQRIIIIEFSVTLILSTVPLPFMVVIFRRKSLLKIWKQSPGLSLFLGSITLLAVFNGLVALEWILFAFGLLENAPQNTVPIIAVNEGTVLTAQFHNCAIIALFAQRIHHLLFPTRKVKTFNYIVVANLGLFWIATCVILTYVMVSNINFSLNPVPEGCFTYNCMSSSELRAYTGILVAPTTSGLTLTGTFMAYLYHRYRKRNYSTEEKKTNTFTLYVFYVRSITITVPLLLEFILSATRKSLLMDRRVVIAEFCLTLVLSIMALCILGALFRRKSVLKIWKESPPLSLFFVSLGVLSVCEGSVSIQWLFFAFGLIENAPHNTVLIITIPHATTLTGQLHTCAIISLFSHRIHCLLYPMGNVKKFNRIMLGILGCFSLAASFVLTYILFVSINSTINPVPERCFSVNCTSAYTTEVRICNAVVIVFVSCVMTLIGSYMVYLYQKFKKRKYSSQEKKTNTFTLYIFYVSFLCTTVPFLCEIVLSTTTKISLGQIIGPYGIFGSSIDNLIQVLVYFMLTRPQKNMTFGGPSVHFLTQASSANYLCQLELEPSWSCTGIQYSNVMKVSLFAVR